MQISSKSIGRGLSLLDLMAFRLKYLVEEKSHSVPYDVLYHMQSSHRGNQKSVSYIQKTPCWWY